jgi:hypothetical protein
MDLRPMIPRTLQERDTVSRGPSDGSGPAPADIHVTSSSRIRGQSEAGETATAYCPRLLAFA